MTTGLSKGISFGSYRFAPRLVPTLLALFVFVLTLSLGNWQIHRAEEKLVLQQRLDAFALGPVLSLTNDLVQPQAVVDHRVSARGHFVADKTLYIDNRIYHGVPGYHVVTPFHIDGGDVHVLVNRGWIASGVGRDRLPPISTPTETISIEGVAVVPLARPFELAPDANSGPLRQNLVPERVAEEMKISLQPVVVLQTGAAKDGLMRDWPKPDAGVDMHRAYALQWYVMAILAVAFWFGLNLRRNGAKQA